MKYIITDEDHARYGHTGTYIKGSPIPYSSPRLMIHTIEFDDGGEEQFLSYQIDSIDTEKILSDAELREVNIDAGCGSVVGSVVIEKRFYNAQEAYLWADRIKGLTRQ